MSQMLCPNGPSRPPCPPPRYGAHPHYLTAHSCMSFTSAVCIAALLVATINSAAVETRDPPCICLCLGVESGPGEESEGAVYPAFVPQCLPCRECLSRRAFTCDSGWVERVAGQNGTSLRGWREARGRELRRWRTRGRWCGEQGSRLLQDSLRPPCRVDSW